MADLRDFPVTVRDAYGDSVTIDVIGTEVMLGDGMWLFDAETFEEFSQALIAARHVADRQARPVPCGAVSPYAGPPCGQYGDRAEHIAREAGGIIVASWPVSDG